MMDPSSNQSLHYQSTNFRSGLQPANPWLGRQSGSESTFVSIGNSLLGNSTDLVPCLFGLYVQWASLCSEDGDVNIMCRLLYILYSVARTHRDEEPVHCSRKPVNADRG